MATLKPETQPESPRFWRSACAVFALVAVAKTLHAPNTWAYSQAVLTYSSGAVRRCLFGSLLALLHMQTYLRFAAVSGWIVLLLLAATALLAWQAGLFRTADGSRLAALFAIGYALSYTVDVIGYLENVILLLVVVALLLRRRPIVYLFAGGMVAAAVVLIHENSVFFAVPVLAAAAVAQFLQDGGRRKGLMVATLASIGVGTAVALAFVMARPPMTFAAADALGARLQLQTRTPLEMDFFYTQCTTVPMLMHRMVVYYRNIDYWIAQVEGAIAMPLDVVFAWFSLAALRRLAPGPNGSRSGLRWLCLAASFAPLAMHFLGWDLYRWDALANWTALLVFLLLAPQAGVVLTVLQRNVVVALMVLAAAAGPGVMDKQSLHGFPDVHQVPAAIRLLTGKPQHVPTPGIEIPATKAVAK